MISSFLPFTFNFYARFLCLNFLGKLLKRILPINFNIEENTYTKKKKALAEFVHFLWMPYTAPQTNGLNNRKLLSHFLEASGLRSRYWQGWFLLRAERQNLFPTSILVLAICWPALASLGLGHHCNLLSSSLHGGLPGWVSLLPDYHFL